MRDCLSCGHKDHGDFMCRSCGCHGSFSGPAAQARYAKAMAQEQYKRAWEQMKEDVYRRAVMASPPSGGGLPSFFNGALPPAPQYTPPAPLTKADLAGPILAYRQWRVDGERLTSVTRADAWPWGRPFQASEKPTQHTHAGLYAAKDCARLDYQRSGPEVVTGRVALWGVVIEHEHGYRAEYAYPYELFTPPAPMPGFPGSGAARIKAIAERYGIGTREAA